MSSLTQATAPDAYSAYGQTLPPVETVQQDYRDGLADLTFNSKPIITNLTIIASENKHAAVGIVREVEAAARNAPRHQKLPYLYLLDSICKNVGQPYLQLFARNIVSTFLDTYAVADAPTRERLERLEGTWRNGLPDGSPVFARHLLESIEKTIALERQRIRGRIGGSLNANHNVAPNNRGRIPHQGLPPRSQAAHTSYRSPQMQAQETFRQGGVAYDNGETIPTSDVFNKLQGILPSMPSIPPSRPIAGIEQQLADLIKVVPAQNTASSSPYVHPAPIYQAAPFPAVSAHSTPADTTAGAGVTDLLQGLMNYGLLGSNGSATSTPQSFVSTPTQSVVSLPQSTTNTPPIDISMIERIPLETKALRVKRPGTVALLYEAYPLQCKQCAMRYPKTAEGQQRMDAHLDWHFRQNRRLKDKGRRGISRAWFVTREDWISGDATHSIGEHAPAFFEGESAGHVPSATQAQSELDMETLAKQSVILPASAYTKPCPICGEKFSVVWDDTVDEWKLPNAVQVDDVIYHATCHADAMRQQKESPQSPTAPSDAAILKRKLEELDEVAEKTKVHKTE
ncbi:hypothetical protein BZG36_01956 [Bifiguratus adelaidae]|uniref:CID domain-containing protein n=1 Tax=Bifiguratus adelaidae TaxID=1938954 RepID=A0A261Y3T9_9FUNG|nr:hypothetical protein BZG36_01956 [Bifiguratus adelaidae]